MATTRSKKIAITEKSISTEKTEGNGERMPTIPVSDNPGSRKADSTCSRKSSVALRVLRAAQLREQKVRREVELEKRLLAAETEVGFAKLALEDGEESEESLCDPHERVERYVNSLNPPNYVHPEAIVDRPSNRITPAILCHDLPKVELSHFDGSPSNYWRFIRQFETHIENRVADDAQRLLYLMYYCDGEAELAIEECAVLDPTEGYKLAKSILKGQFGQPHLVARAMLDGLLKTAKGTTNEARSLSDLSRKMRSCQIALGQMDYLSDLNATHTLEYIVKCLPLHMRHKWAEIVDGILFRHSEPTFRDLNEFIERQARISQSRFGRLAIDNEYKRIPQSSTSTPRFDIRRHPQSFIMHSREKASNVEVRCTSCSGQHHLARCGNFQSISVSERWRHVRTSKLCFLCLNPSHIAKDCDQPMKCVILGDGVRMC